MAGKIVAAVLVGVAAGRFLLPAAWAGWGEQFVMYALALMVFGVGIDIGRHRAVFWQLLHRGWGLVAVPLAVALGSLGGAALAAWLLAMPVRDGLAVGAAFGWYSLAGPLITHLHGPVLGATAFLANVFRELLAFMIIPACVARWGGLAALAPSGATAMDSTLPLIAKVTDPETSLLAFFSGLILTVLAPPLMTLLLTM